MANYRKYGFPEYIDLMDASPREEMCVTACFGSDVLSLVRAVRIETLARQTPSVSKVAVSSKTRPCAKPDRKIQNLRADGNALVQAFCTWAHAACAGIKITIFYRSKEVPIGKVVLYPAECKALPDERIPEQAGNFFEEVLKQGRSNEIKLTGIIGGVPPGVM